MMTEINDAIKEKYAKHIPNLHPVAYDGIVNEDVFKTQPYRTLFLLKDANPDAHEDGNAYVCDDLRNTAESENPSEINLSSTTWRNVCRWSKIIALPQSCETDCWSSPEVFDVEKMRKYLSNISVVNIKKTFGKGVNEDENKYSAELSDAVEKYFDLVKDEIDLIDPVIIICGGTFEYILPRYFSNKKERNSSIKYLSTGARYFVISETGKNRLFLDFVHPGARISPKFLFSYFKETYTALIKEYTLLADKT